MKSLNRATSLLASALVSTIFLTAGCNQSGETEQASAAPVTLDTPEQKVTYIVGYRMASQAKAGDFTIDQAVMQMAIQDVLDGKEPRIPQSEQQQVMMAFQQEQEEKRQAALNEEATQNLEKGKAFLAENAEKDGITVTESGLQYQIVSRPDESAPSPTEDDKVKVHYHGTLIDGTVFDSSVDRGSPVTFPVTGVIKGWIEALQLMKVGDKFKLFIPPEIAYGQGGTGPIGPNSTLIFDVELLEINPEEAQAANPHGGGNPHSPH